MNDEDMPLWPNEQEMAEYEADMARRPVEVPTDAEIEAMVSAWLKYHERHLQVIDEYYASLRARGLPRPPF